MSPPNLFRGRVIGKVMPISYISKCHPLKSDAPSIRWLLIFSSCLLFDLMYYFFFLFSTSPTIHALSLCNTTLVWAFFGGSLLIQLRPLSLPVHSTAVESDSINLWPKTCRCVNIERVWLCNNYINLVILANYEPIRWHRSAYLIISQLRVSVSHKLVLKGQAR